MKKITTLFSLALVALLALNAQAQESMLGKEMKDLPKMKDANNKGKKASFADFKDAKGFVLVFTCNHCPFSVAYEDRLIALDKKFKSKGYPVIAVNPNDPAQYPSDGYKAMVSRAKNKGFTFPYLLDPTSNVARAYKASRTPHVYILQKQGQKYKIVYVGAIDDSARDESKISEKYVETAIANLLKGKKPSKNYTRAIGCSIKMRNQ
ncbi:thioredoxin family protein [Microscilla marina]|uniref:Thiol-disulfide isomerase/thioredoxin n=1 Tax=Microscilla marina ATCC 23134 TaxID=313606 RepID=A1ZKF3_MICM2|nr:thioredoxin family protein [Microscilla marina]EAY29179.1 thiol-disulfide isomerase/thioredoxin [Microscilla marina ATCC 23134]